MKIGFREWRRAMPRGMTIAVAISFIFLNSLGVWQLYRLQWKEGLIADMARSEAMPPLPAMQLLSQTRPAWRSVRLPSCKVTTDHLIYMHSEMNGTLGYRVLTACPLPQGAILVDLGFMTAKTPLTAQFMPVGRLRPFEKSNAITPVNRPSEQEWYWRSASEMGADLQVPVRDDYFLVLDLKASSVHMPGLVQGPVVAPLRNRHFDYALTWFGLAWALIGMFVSYVYQRAAQNKAATDA
ncbi:SURF1 family protein [Asticcacaulis sp. EMRT-3]|uniref:SURF1 family protein n=1 Tax=Asticcacaulis sp. EMRT-3 TaxID=3040349 RepID=UPI0024AEB848|nr:SURF1 family protein [Asticcacaulis sp. EMRT-3]MDI7774711.1 SURF1 family protein [Asticcacaulis sp. EMRT-3]